MIVTKRIIWERKKKKTMRRIMRMRNRMKKKVRNFKFLENLLVYILNVKVDILFNVTNREWIRENLNIEIILVKYISVHILYFLLLILPYFCTTMAIVLCRIVTSARKEKKTWRRRRFRELEHLRWRQISGTVENECKIRINNNNNCDAEWTAGNQTNRPTNDRLYS